MSNLKWRTVLKLAFRKFGRQFEDTDIACNEVKRQIQELEPLRASFDEISETYWPVRPEAVDGFEKRGVFVISKEVGGYQVVIRELPVIIVCDSYEDAEVRLKRVLEVLPGKFAGITVAREYLTDLVAE